MPPKIIFNNDEIDIIKHLFGNNSNTNKNLQIPKLFYLETKKKISYLTLHNTYRILLNEIKRNNDLKKLNRQQAKIKTFEKNLPLTAEEKDIIDAQNAKWKEAIQFLSALPIYNQIESRTGAI